MKRITKITALILSLVTITFGISNAAHGEEVSWDIENTLDVSKCTQGSAVTMTVSLKGSSSSQPQNIISMSGILEYDNSLFTVQKADIIPAESGKVQSWSFDPFTGTFDITYASDITVQNGGVMFQILLHTAADATAGKTTLCVTNMKWRGSESAEAAEIEHRIPARIIIEKAEEPAAVTGDVNLDGKVNLTDAKLVMQYYNGTKKLNSQQKKNADTNGDGKVNLTDAKLIMKYYNGEISEF